MNMLRLLILLMSAFSSTLFAKHKSLFYDWNEKERYLKISWTTTHIDHSRNEKQFKTVSPDQINDEFLRDFAPIDTFYINADNAEITQILSQMKQTEIRSLKIWGYARQDQQAFHDLVAVIAKRGKTLKKLAILHAENNFPLFPEHLRALSGLPLESISGALSYPPKGNMYYLGTSNQLLPEITLFKDTLQELILEETWITKEKAIKALADLSQLKKLVVRSPISREAIHVIKYHNNLTHLDLADANRLNNKRILDILKVKKNLVMFAFPDPHYPIMDSASVKAGTFVSHLKKVLPNNKSLKMVAFGEATRANREIAETFETYGISVKGDIYSFSSKYDKEWKKKWSED